MLTLLCALALGADLPEGVSKDYAAELSPDAVTVPFGKQTATFHFRKAIPIEANAAQIANGLTCRELAPTEPLGIVTFSGEWIDFRKQKIAAGSYTLRYVLQPTSDDHADTAPYPEFLLLTPIAEDVKPTPLPVKTVLEMSRKSTTTEHPSVMLLYPGKGADRVAEVGNGRQVLFHTFAVSADGKPAKLALGLVVVR